MQYRLVLALAAAFGMCWGTIAHAQEISRDAPWALRTHYSFPQSTMVLDYGAKTSRMRLRQGDEVVANDMRFEIQLQDGTVLTYEDFDDAATDRFQFTDEAIGPAMRYGTLYPARNGLTLQYIVTVYQKRPLITAHMEITNSGDMPFGVRGMHPLVTGPEGVEHLSPNAHMHERRVTWRGGYPLFDQDANPTMTAFHDHARAFMFAVGFLPDGQSDSGTKFEAHGDQFHGRAFCNFEPPVRVNPGATIKSDRMVIYHGGANPDHLDLYYSWASAQVNPPKDNRDGPRAWVTVREEQGLSSLLEGVRRWNRRGVSHALIPGSWEGVPGSLQGGSGYPKRIASAAADLSKAGAVPGLTIDPLAVDRGPGDSIAESADGQRWLNPASPAAASFAKKRFSDIADWGFGFTVVEPSLIPDDVLSRFGLTRARADALALALVEQALGDRHPVYPAAGKSVRAVRADWLEAAGAIGHMGQYSKGWAPVRLEVNGLDGVQPDAFEAMRLWRGPIEILGDPKNSGAKDIERLLDTPHPETFPTDLYGRLFMSALGTNTDAAPEGGVNLAQAETEQP